MSPAGAAKREVKEGDPMSDGQFDLMLTALARARTRREMLAAIGMASAGTAGSANAVEGQSNGCRGASSRCKRDGHCCSGRCRKRRDAKKGRCRCSVQGARCGVTGDCCDGEVELVCDMGQCEPALQD